MKISSFALICITLSSTFAFGGAADYVCESSFCMANMDPSRRRDLSQMMPQQGMSGESRNLQSAIVLDFEGVGDLVTIDDFYASEGVYFSPNALGIIDFDAGGSGNFANEPTPDTTMFFLSGGDVHVNVPGGFTTGFSFYYSSSFPATVSVYSDVNGGGTQLATLNLDAQHDNNCAGDPNGDFCNWTPIGVTFSGTAKSIDFGGAANSVGFDEITFGSQNPGMMDDPHLKSWVGEWFDYMGECDLLLARVPKFDGELDVDIHVRTTIRYDYSFIEAAALRIGDDILEVGSWGEYALNGVEGATDDAEMVPALGGYPVHHKQVNKKKHVFDVMIGPSQNITVSTMKDWVSVQINQGDFGHFGNVTGLMGTYAGKMLARDGTNLHDSIDALGQDWQVRPEEGNLFRTVRHPQYPQKCLLPSEQDTKVKRRLGENIQVEAAEKACVHLSGKAFSFCVHDVMASGDLEMAQAGAF